MWGLINYNFDSDENGGGANFATYSLLGAAAIVAGTLSGITGPIVKATLQNVTMPTHRGQAFALLNTFDDFGRGLGPAFVARMIEKMGRQRAFKVDILWILERLVIFYSRSRRRTCETGCPACGNKQ